MGKCLYPRKGSVHTAPEGAGGRPAIGTPLNDMTWEQIREISDLGLAADYFAVGDTKSITINGTVGLTTISSLSVDAFILGIDHNASVEGSNLIHFGLGKIGGVDVCLCDSEYNTTATTSGYFTMNTSNTNAGGWSSCHMRKTVLGSDSTPTSPTANTLLAALPADLRAVMKAITKYSDNTGGGSDTASYVTATTDYLPLLAEFEIAGARSKANSAEQNYQVQYAYYSAGNSKVKHKHNATGTVVIWWLRSVAASGGGIFCRVYTDGTVSTRSASYSFGVSPIFAV